ncbi:MAG: hypothetical protein R3C24_18970 [Cyanobacteriota/Melainabacteria group bacterium]
MSLLFAACGFWLSHFYRLDSYNIKREPTHVPKGYYHPGVAPVWRTTKFLYNLERLDGNRIVLVIHGTKDGSMFLNPRRSFGVFKFDYGPIPETKDLLKKDIEQLLGIPASKTGNILSYDLAQKYIDPRDKSVPVSVDLKFAGENLSQFRIRAAFIEDPKFVDIVDEPKDK